MCYFITVALSENKAEFLEKHVPRGLHIRRIAHQSVLQHAPHGFCAYLLMSGGCSCALFNESPKESDGNRQVEDRLDQERLRRKYQKRGWSTVKTNRALRQHATSSKASLVVGLRGDVQQFLGELAMNVEQLAVLVHWYDGDVQDARFSCKEGDVVSPKDVLGEGLRVSPDEIVWIKTRH